MRRAPSDGGEHDADAHVRERMTRRCVVLHVTESYGAGTATAIHRFVRSVPEAEHHLLRRVRQDSAIDERDAGFRSVTDLPAPGPAALRTIRRTAARIAPTTVHLHSSIGGALGRAALIATRDRRLVYSPHCFAFERRDLRRPVRVGLRAIEGLLSLNTTVTAACSTREAALASRMRPGAHAVYVPNVAEDHRLRTDPGLSVPVVVTIGRAGPQKDPSYFAAVAREAARLVPGTRFIWIGGGEPADEQVLRNAGVEVTGWLDDAEDWPVMPAGAVYLHTAAWEGYPLAILEAHRAGLPIAARRIPALQHADPRIVVAGPERLAALVASLLVDPDARRTNRRLWDAETVRNSPARQRDALLECYDLGSAAS